MSVEHVEGKNKGTVMLYALSTCQWCMKTKALLKELGIGFSCIYVDLLDAEERDNMLREINRLTGSYSFPTLVIDGKKFVVGFREDEITEALT